MKVSSIAELCAMWESDAARMPDLGDDTAGFMMKIASLHSKYVAIRAHHSMRSKDLELQHRRTRLDRIAWYRGKLSEDEIKEYGWDPAPARERHKDEAVDSAEADDIVMKLEAKAAHHDEIVKTCEKIIKNIDSWQFTMQNAIKWEMWTRGAR